jgi:hypothetical protein
MGEEQHIFMKTNKMKNILIKFWTFDYRCVLKQFFKKCIDFFKGNVWFRGEWDSCSQNNTNKSKEGV